jgi:hypothetical protein
MTLRRIQRRYGCRDPAWSQWSADALAMALDHGVVVIGAHAAVRGCRLLTRDAARYRAYCPTLALMAPESGRPSGHDFSERRDRPHQGS